MVFVDFSFQSTPVSSLSARLRTHSWLILSTLQTVPSAIYAVVMRMAVPVEQAGIESKTHHYYPTQPFRGARFPYTEAEARVTTAGKLQVLGGFGPTHGSGRSVNI